MPSTSQAQHGFMAMSRTAAGRRKFKAHGKKPAPMSVANDFMKADKGRKMSSMPVRAKKK